MNWISKNNFTIKRKSNQVNFMGRNNFVNSIDNRIKHKNNNNNINYVNNNNSNKIDNNINKINENFYKILGDNNLEEELLNDEKIIRKVFNFSYIYKIFN